MNDWKQWDGFEGRLWKEEVNTRDFIQKNYQPYDGDASFLENPEKFCGNRKKGACKPLFFWVSPDYNR